MRLRQARSDIRDAERDEFPVAIDGNAAAQFIGSRQHAEIGERHECDGGACRQRQPFIGRKRRTCCRKLALPALRCAAGNRTRTLRLMEDLHASRQALQKERVAGNNAQRQGTTSKETRMRLSILINCSDPTVSHDYAVLWLDIVEQAWSRQLCNGIDSAIPAAICCAFDFAGI
jgi:hypothetical protein